MKDWSKIAVALHKKTQGKLEIRSRVPLETRDDLSAAYTPGVAEVSLQCAKDPLLSYDLTMKGRSVAIVSDGTAVLGLGNIGPYGALPVMEGKAILLKRFADVDAIPLCINTKDPKAIVAFCKAIEPTFGAIMLEDIAAPACVEIERTLEKELGVPVFHDDQHGTAIVVGAAIVNCARLMKRPLDSFRVVVSGTGAAGSSVCRTIRALGVKSLFAYNKQGVVTMKKHAEYDFVVRELLDEGIVDSFEGVDSLEAMMDGIDIFVGVSAPNILKQEAVKRMAKQPIVFAMANPTPEIDPLAAKEAGAYIVGTGRSDHPNQINNVLAFPGLMKGALQARAKKMTPEMKLAASKALAELIADEELSVDYIVPGAFDPRVADAVAKAASTAALL
jgi:malate dehydrogenase (oxaloacetate-decarboxylating)